jgi:hypothetical protein
MAEQRITNNTAPIYTADLMYEDHGKCHTTKVLTETDTWVRDMSDTSEDYGAWKIVALTDGATLSALVADNISAADCTKLIAVTYEAGQELMADEFSTITCATGTWICYMGCHNS